VDDQQKRRRWILLLALLLLLLLAGSLTTWAAWPDGKVAHVKELRTELFSEKGREMAPEERQKKWEELRNTMKQMTPAQRRQLNAEARKRRNAELSRYFAMSPTDKIHYLDERIARDEQRRQAWQARQAQGNGGNGATPRRGQAEGSGQPGDPSAGGETSANKTQLRDQRRMDRLDDTTPAERAQNTLYVKEMNDRRIQLGLPVRGGPR
jgi:hypothetical protein